MIKKFVRSIFTIPSKSDRLLDAAITVLLVFSSIMIVSACMSSRTTIQTDTFHNLYTSLLKSGVIREAFKQTIIVVISFAVYHLASHIYTRRLVNKYIFYVGIAVIGLLLFASTFSNNTVSNAWIRLGPISIQPSELAKPTIVLLIAKYCCDKNSKQLSALDLTLHPLIFYFVSAAIIILLQSDLGSAFCLLAIGAITFLMVNNKAVVKMQKWLLGIIIAGVAIVSILMIPAVTNYLYSTGHFTYQLARFKTVIDPSWDVYGYSRELINSLVAIMKGNWLGVGLGQSVLKYGYIASSSADYIFAIIIEETGLIGLTIIFGCYGIILYRLFKYAFKVKRNSQKCILVGTISYLFVHLFLNVGGVSALIPLTGVPLLLVSSAGSACISIMGLLGICQRIISDYKTEEVSGLVK